MQKNTKLIIGFSIFIIIIVILAVCYLLFYKWKYNEGFEESIKQPYIAYFKSDTELEPIYFKSSDNNINIDQYSLDYGNTYYDIEDIKIDDTTVDDTGDTITNLIINENKTKDNGKLEGILGYYDNLTNKIYDISNDDQSNFIKAFITKIQTHLASKTPVTPEETTSTSPEETPAITPGETTSTAPEETPTITPEETTSTAPEETTSTAPGETPTVTPEETTSTAPEETTSTAPEETTSTSPEETTSTSPGGTPAITPGGTTSTASEETPAITPGETPAITPGGTTSTAPMALQKMDDIVDSMKPDESATVEEKQEYAEIVGNLDRVKQSFNEENQNIVEEKITSFTATQKKEVVKTLSSLNTIQATNLNTVLPTLTNTNKEELIKIFAIPDYKQQSLTVLNDTTLTPRQQTEKINNILARSSRDTTVQRIFITPNPTARRNNSNNRQNNSNNRQNNSNNRQNNSNERTMTTQQATQYNTRNGIKPQSMIPVNNKGVTVSNYEGVLNIFYPYMM